FVVFYLPIKVILFLVDALFFLPNPVLCFTHLSVSVERFFIMLGLHMDKLFFRLQLLFLTNCLSPYFCFFYYGLRLNFGFVKSLAGVLGKNEFTRYNAND